MAEAKITLESGSLNTATASLERIAALYTKIGAAQSDLGRKAIEHERRHASAGGGHGGEHGEHGGPGSAGRFAQRLAQSITGARPAQGPVAEMAGRALEMAEPVVEALGPIGMAAGALVVVFGALEETTRHAAAALASFAAGAMQMGATGMQAAELGAMGVSPQEAMAFRMRQGSDPFAMMEAGFQMDPRFGGNQNTGGGILAQLERLHRMGPGDAQLLAARRMGLEGHLGDVNVSEDVFEQRRQVGEQRAALLGSSQAALDLTARYKILEEQMETMGMAIAVNLMPHLNAFLAWMIGSFNTVDKLLHPGTHKDIENPLGEHKEAVKENTDALQDLRSTMEKGRSVTGGGTAGQGIPSHLRGDEMYRAMRNNSYRYGAFH